MSNIDQTTRFLSEFANRATTDARSFANRITTWHIPTLLNDFKFDPQKPNLEKPPGIGDLLNEYEKQDINVLMLNDVAEQWLNKWFPNIGSCMSYQPEEWACGILSGEKPFGLNREHFEAVWHDGRDRAYRQAAAESEQIRAEFSQRGFSIPPGAMIAAQRASEIRASEAIADINRQQTIKDAEITLELIKFAADTSAKLKTGMMSMLASFFSNIVRLANHDPGADKMRAKAQAYSAFMSAMSNYYNVELNFENLRLKAAQIKAGVDVDNAKVRLDADAKGVDSRNQALGQAARGFTDAAGAAANAQSSLQAELYSGTLS